MPEKDNVLKTIWIGLCFRTESTSQQGLSKAELKAQRYYQACMSEDKIEELGARPLQELINKVKTHSLKFMISP